MMAGSPGPLRGGSFVSRAAMVVLLALGFVCVVPALVVYIVHTFRTARRGDP